MPGVRAAQLILFAIIIISVCLDHCAAITCKWTNLAYKKSTRASSHHVHHGRPQLPKYLVDGDRRSFISKPNENCWHPALGAKRNWWIVDLGRRAFIHHISIVNRGDCCEDRLMGTVVAVADGDPTKVWPPRPVDVCGQVGGYVGRGHMWTTLCLKMASKVVVYKYGIINICEVEVYGISL